MVARFDAPQKAVDALIATIAAGLAANLTQVEIDNGLAAGKLPTPNFTQAAREPFMNLAPVGLQIYEDGFSPDDPAGQRNKVWDVPCVIVITHSGTPKQEVNEAFMRRYVDAVLRTVLADVTQTGAVITTLFQGADAGAAEGDDAETRHIYELSFIVQVQTDKA